MNNPSETSDFYYNEQGFVVFTQQYHMQRGYCCGNGCIHCPYSHQNVEGSLNYTSQPVSDEKKQ